MKKIDRKVNPTLESWWQPSFRAKRTPFPPRISSPVGDRIALPLLREPHASSFARIENWFVMLITRLFFRLRRDQNLPLTA